MSIFLPYSLHGAATDAAAHSNADRLSALRDPSDPNRLAFEFL